MYVSYCRRSARKSIEVYNIFLTLWIQLLAEKNVLSRFQTAKKWSLTLHGRNFDTLTKPPRVARNISLFLGFQGIEKIVPPRFHKELLVFPNLLCGAQNFKALLAVTQ